MVEDAVYYLAGTVLDGEYWLSVCRRDVPVCSVTEHLEPIHVDLKRNLLKV